MLEFLRIYKQWIIFSDDGIALKESTPKHIVDLFNDIRQEQEENRKKGIFID